MVGASDLGVSTALAAQSKQIESQSKHLAAQSKLLQQLCDRIEAQDLQWSSLKQSVANNAEDISSIHLRLDHDREDLSCNLDAHLASQTAAFEEIAREQIGSVVAHASTRVAALESVTSCFESWRPRIERSVEGVQDSLTTMREELAKVSQLLERGVPPDPQQPPGNQGHEWTAPDQFHATAPQADGPYGHQFDNYNREQGFGGFYPHNLLPTNGMPPGAFPHHEFEHPQYHVGTQFHGSTYPPPHTTFGGRAFGTQFTAHLGKLPQLNFPAFDGEFPKLLQSRCEKYFAMYGVDPIVWTQVATMHFLGSTARWLQSIEHKLPSLTWSEFGG
jgi:hypothetical protein